MKVHSLIADKYSIILQINEVIIDMTWLRQLQSIWIILALEKAQRLELTLHQAVNTSAKLLTAELSSYLLVTTIIACLLTTLRQCLPDLKQPETKLLLLIHPCAPAKSSTKHGHLVLIQIQGACLHCSHRDHTLLPLVQHQAPL